MTRVSMRRGDKFMAFVFGCKITKKNAHTQEKAQYGAIKINFSCTYTFFFVPLHPNPTLEGVCPAKSVSQWFFLG